MSDNIVDLANEAQKRGKFSLADAIKGRGFPEKSVDVYLDARSAYELEAVNEELDVLARSQKMDEYDKLNEKARELADAILASKLTFHMRGVGQSKVEEITKKADALFPEAKAAGSDESDWVRYYLAALVASNIVKVTDAEGNEDSSAFTPDELIELRGIMPIDSWEILIETMQKLTLASSYFEAVTDAGFLPKS